MTSSRRLGSGAAALATLLLGGALLAGCGASAPSSSASAQQAPAAGAAAPYSDAGGGSGSSGSGASGTKGAAAPLSGDTASGGRSLIVTAALQIDVPNVDTAVARAVSATTAEGGYVADESVGDGVQQVPAGADPGGSGVAVSGAVPDFPTPSPVANRQAVLVLRVAPDRVDALIAQLSGSGTVTYQTRDSTDVTTQVADVDSRVDSARDSIAELRTLMNRATGMTDLTNLENTLAQQESDLESLEAQQKALSDEVGMATVTIELLTPAKGAVAPAAVRGGFVSGLKGGWHALAVGGRALLIAVGWVLPFAVVLGLVWYLARRLRAQRARRAVGAAPPAAPATAPAATPAD